MSTVKLNLEEIISKKIEESISNKIDEIIDKAFSNLLGHIETSENKQLNEIDYPSKDNNFKNEWIEKDKNPKYRIYSKLTNKFENVTEDNKNEMPDDAYLMFEVNSYLSTMNEAMNRLRNYNTKYNTTGGLFEITANKDKGVIESYEDSAFFNYLNNLTWEELDKLIYNNDKINKDNIPPIVKDKMKPIDVYYIIIKNTLSNCINDLLKLNIPDEIQSWDVNNYMKNLLLKEILSSIDTIINNVIFNYNRQIFNTLFDKKYYLDETKNDD